jgi:hypothetical protein
VTAPPSAAPQGRPVPWDRWDAVSVGLGLTVAAVVFAFKMKAFLGLAYTGDLFEHVQFARSWMEGRLLEGHSHGRILSIHTYFFLLPLGLLARPLGAPGLFLALAVASGLACVLAARILRVLEVPGPAAAAFALLLIAGPFSAANIHDRTHGFHVELLLPSMTLGLLLALIQRKLLAALVAALLMISVKEDVPLLVAIVGVLVLTEDLVQRKRHGVASSPGINKPAVAVILLAAAAFPLLLHVIQVNGQAAQPPSENGFLRLARAREAGVTETWGLLRFVTTHPWSWLSSNVVASWLWSMALATYGLVALRPHGWLLGLPLTLVAWLIDDPVTWWSARFAPSLAYAWCVTLLGFASLWRFVAAAPRPLPLSRRVALEAFALVAAASVPLALPKRGAVELYTFGPRSNYTAVERQQADQVFQRYRREGRREEPAAAGTFLLRYAHDRNFYWLDHLDGWPRPRWILADQNFKGYQAYGLDPDDYEVIERQGPFTLHRARTPPRR